MLDLYAFFKWFYARDSYYRFVLSIQINDKKDKDFFLFMVLLSQDQEKIKKSSIHSIKIYMGKGEVKSNSTILKKQQSLES